MAKETFWGKVSGEISKLRDNMAFGFRGMVMGGIGAGYKLDSSRVDYELTKQLYYNTHEDYKLGGGFAKAIINNSVAFIGAPSFRTADPDAEEVLSDFQEAHLSEALRTIRNALRDGDCFVWITREDEKDKSLYPEAETRLVYNVLPPGMVKDVIRDPLTNHPTEYILESFHEWTDERGNQKRGTVRQRLRRGLKIIEVDGDVPEGVEIGETETRWDFIPIVHFKNEGDEDAVFGRSDLEVIEPYLKAYHDVMLHAMTGSKMHSTPRLKLKVKDVKAFLYNNMGIDDPVKFARQGGTLNLDGKEMLIFGPDEDAEFIEVRSATGDAKELLKLLFYCIVDASETPEFVFGVHTPSSLSSVKEQMPILIRSIDRKRQSFTGSWQRLARIVLAMTASAENRSFETYATEITWQNIDPRTGQEISQELLNVVNALVAAKNSNLISEEAAVSFLSQFVDTMNEWESEEGENEKDRIMRSRLSSMRLEDSQFLEEQRKKIDEMIGVTGGGRQ